MSRKVTLQDIADALNLSRNTVSKAINNSNGISDSTREMILQKAVEMGYKQFSYVKSASATPFINSEYFKGGDTPKEIALFTTSALTTSHFASLMLDKLLDEIQSMGLSLVTYRVTNDDLSNLKLPITFNKNNVCAVICIEIFDYAYSEMLCTLDLPVLFVDCPPLIGGKELNADILLMNNTTGISQVINDCIKNGTQRFGFIGDYMHCQSFFERYSAFRTSLLANELPIDEKYIIRYEDGNVSTMAKQLESLERFPEVFICANDFVAIDAMLILRNLSKKIPEDIRFLGFDDSQESRSFSPTLSTVHIHTQSMAYSAVQLLASRMIDPKLENRIVHVATDLIYRESLTIDNDEVKE